MVNKKKKVLLAEDERSINRAFKIGFESSGFDVTTTFCGEDCLIEAKKNTPDVILLDLLMPKMSGESVLTELKKDKDTKDIPVIILTNFSDEEKSKAVLEMGAVDYIVKSNSTLDQVVEKVKAVLEK